MVTEFKKIVTRDEIGLRIIGEANGSPKLLGFENCRSSTLFEFPTIVSLDNSGSTKICIPCSETFDDFDGRLTIFGPPPGQHWAPARNIWHQYAYNPLFINDDGTVPQYIH